MLAVRHMEERKVGARRAICGEDRLELGLRNLSRQRSSGWNRAWRRSRVRICRGFARASPEEGIWNVFAIVYQVLYGLFLSRASSS